MPRLFVACAFALAGCGTATVVPLVSTAGAPYTLTPRPDVPLEVVTRGTGVRDPLPVEGGGTSYGEVETALGHAVASATVPWAEARQAAHGGHGWQLLVELTQADARYSAQRLVVTMTVRATLRTRGDHHFLAQTQARCSTGAMSEPRDGAPVLYGCMSSVGRDLAAWLGGVPQ